MNRHAILHIQDSPYCFPVSENEMVLRLRTAKDDVRKVSVLYESKYVIGESHREAHANKVYTNELFDWYECRLNLLDTRLAYVFFVEGDEGGFYFSEDGLSENYDFALGYYNFFQYPYINDADVVKPVDWMKSAVFYQIFVDRFNRGIMDKDDSYINLKWGEKPTPKSFAGGDIPGITQKLPYLKDLGISALYLTPIFESPSNHKYDTIDYYNVDPHFGTGKDLKELVEKAHGLGIRIVLDAVFNHVSKHCKLFADVVKKGRKSKYYDWFVIYGDKPDTETGNYEQFASCKYMPKLNTSNPAVREYLIKVATYYIKEYDIDGWRLDVSDEISQDFWRHFRNAVKAAKPDAVIIGENWHDAYRNLRGDQYDSIMNYSFTKAALDFFAFDALDAEGLVYRLNTLTMRNKEGVNRMMLNLLDSHDTHRFFTQVKGDAKKAAMALALLFFYQGAPCIYYGTEILMPGGFDPDCRRCMDFKKSGENGPYADTYDLIRSLAAMRRTEPLDDGAYRYSAEKGLFITTCTADGHVYRLIINNTGKQKKLGTHTIPAQSFLIDKDGKEFLK